MYVISSTIKAINIKMLISKNEKELGGNQYGTDCTVKSLTSFLRNFSARQLCIESLQGMIDFNKFSTGQQTLFLL